MSDFDHFDLDAFVRTGVLSGQQRGLQGFGTANGHGCRLLLGRVHRPTSERLARARALWHALAVSSYDDLLLTRSDAARQKAERAFAAELLAPASGITTLLGETGGPTDFDDLENLAERYGVASMVIQHQMENAAV